MVGSLIKVGDTSIMEDSSNNRATVNELQEMQQILDFSRDCVKKPGNQAMQMLTDKYNKRPAWLQILFPGKFEKAREELTIEQMKQIFQGELDMLKAHTDLQIKMAENMSKIMIAAMVQCGEGRLAKQGMQIQADLTAFSQIKLNQMKVLFDKSRINYAESYDVLSAKCEQYRHHEKLYNRFRENLDFETDNFFGTIEELLSGFKDALKSKLGEYKT